MEGLTGLYVGEIPPGGAEGVLLAIGSRFGGCVLYVKEGRLVCEYVYNDVESRLHLP